MTTPPLICQRCGSFGPTMADLQELCQGHAPVVDRMPAVVQALDASGQVLASFIPPAGTVRRPLAPTGLPMSDEERARVRRPPATPAPGPGTRRSS